MQSQINKVLELLRDGKWHTIKDVSQKSKIQEFKINVLTDFLAEYSFLDINKKDKKARLAQVFVEFLEEILQL